MELNNTALAQTIFSIIDMVNNRPVGKTRIVKTQDSIWVLKNTEGKLGAILDSGRPYKMTANTIADATFIVEALKMTKEFIVVKVLPLAGGRERRRYQRLHVKTAIKAHFVIQDEHIKGSIHELAYGSFVITTKKRLEQGEELVVHMSELDDETAYICTMYIQKEAENDDENDIWFEGYRYVVLIDKKRSGEKAMELLYTKLQRLLKAGDGNEV